MRIVLARELRYRLSEVPKRTVDVATAHIKEYYFRYTDRELTMSPQIFFIHIEKTAGSSIVKSLIEPNVPNNRRVGTVRSYLKNRSADCAHGHSPHGFHRFTKRPVEYITMLRDPVDRAVSWYYFIKDLVRTDLWRRHPLRDYADSVTLVEFYQNPACSNIQARWMAGLYYHKAYPALHRSALFQRKLLAVAKSNLDDCIAFGLQSEFDASVRIFQETLGWERYDPVPRQAKTKKRPSVSEIEELNPRVLPALRASHVLDQELYDYAVQRFKERLRATPVAN